MNEDGRAVVFHGSERLDALHATVTPVDAVGANYERVALAGVRAENAAARSTRRHALATQETLHLVIAVKLHYIMTKLCKQSVCT